MDVAAQAAGLAISRKSVLLVDSEAEVSVAIQGVLRPEEWNIVQAPDNLSVLKLVEDKSFDLIITGTRSSGKEDVDLLRRIRRVRPHVRRR